jgi:crotonobetainyl-CoA:carnitine CoA-transferase CaiB-like acyl-CoA transferase
VQYASERDCCLEPVLTAAEARADAHLAARKMFFEMPSRWGPIQQMRTPLTPVDREQPGAAGDGSRFRPPS